MAWPSIREVSVWSELWLSATQWLEKLEETLIAQGAAVRRGGDLDNWDLEVRSALFSRVRVHSAVEEHGGGKQLIRFRVVPRASVMHWILPMLLIGVAVAAALNRSQTVAIVIAFMSMLLVLRIVQESAIAMGVALRALMTMREQVEKGALSGLALLGAASAATDKRELKPATAGTPGGNGSKAERKENVRAHSKTLTASAAGHASSASMTAARE